MEVDIEQDEEKKEHELEPKIVALEVTLLKLEWFLKRESKTDGEDVVEIKEGIFLVSVEDEEEDKERREKDILFFSQYF